MTSASGKDLTSTIEPLHNFISIDHISVDDPLNNIRDIYVLRVLQYLPLTAESGIATGQYLVDPDTFWLYELKFVNVDENGVWV